MGPHRGITGPSLVRPRAAGGVVDTGQKTRQAGGVGGAEHVNPAPDGLIVRPDHLGPLLAEAAAPGPEEGRGGAADAGGGASASDQKPSPEPVRPPDHRTATRFYARFDLDPIRGIRQLGGDPRACHRPTRDRPRDGARDPGRQPGGLRRRYAKDRIRERRQSRGQILRVRVKAPGRCGRWTSSLNPSSLKASVKDLPSRVLATTAWAKRSQTRASRVR